MTIARKPTNQVEVGRLAKVVPETVTKQGVSASPQPVSLAATAGRPVSATVVYEDSAGRVWAQEACERILVGPSAERVQSTWWRLEELGEPAVLAAAVSKATSAELIVVAIRATVGFPLPFYVWVGSWVSNRRTKDGKLVALIATPKLPVIERNSTSEYLRVAAQRAGMHLEVTERSVALQVPETSRGRPDKLPPTNAPAPKEILAPLHRYSLRRWRMEE
jgi:hypothetical protein